MTESMWLILIAGVLIAEIITVVLAIKCLMLEFNELIGMFMEKYFPRFYYYDYNEEL